MPKKLAEKITRKIPSEVKKIFEKFTNSGFEIYLVGAGVRALLSDKIPVDCDFTTNALPEETSALFEKSFYDNVFGTVGISTETKRGKEVYEITTYRQEWGYSDKRRPDKVAWGQSLEKDLERRDFTMNAMVIGPKLIKRKWDQKALELIDLFGGQKDFESKLVRAVGEPKKRFGEDALRMMRAIRFAVTLDFEIEKKTGEAIKQNASLLKEIAQERIKDELVKIIMSAKAAWGIEKLRELGLLKYILPELEENYGISQNKHHLYDCYEHALRSLAYAAKNNYNLYVRLAALLHDIAKPRTKQGEGEEATFYNHEIVGAKMTRKILTRLKFPKKEVEKVVKLVRYHLFYYNVDEVGESSVRRLLRNVGLENIEELLQVRYADRIGSGCPKAEPYKLRHLKYLIEKVGQDAISVGMLAVSGHEVMAVLKIQPGPKVGQVLDILLGEVLEEPAKNRSEFLKQRIKELGGLKDKKLESSAKAAKKEREKVATKQDEMTKKKYWVS